MSCQVKLLESTYGVQLFHRYSRRVGLTALGKSLYSVTHRLFSLEEEAELLLMEARELNVGQLKVGADGPHHVIPLLAAFTQRYPNLDVSLDMRNAEKVLRDVTEFRIDVAVVAKGSDDPQLHTRLLGRSRLVVFEARTHPWARRRSIHLKDIASERMILREAASATRQIFERALNQHGVTPQSVLQIESREAVREAVACGLGVGVVAQAEFDRDPRLRLLHLRDVKLIISEHLVCLQERRRLRIVTAFLDIGAWIVTRGMPRQRRDLSRRSMNRNWLRGEPRRHAKPAVGNSECRLFLLIQISVSPTHPGTMSRSVRVTPGGIRIKTSGRLHPN